MELTSARLLKNLPDYDDMIKVSNEIGQLMLDKMKLDIQIKGIEATTVKEVVTNSLYYIGGKPPSMNFIEDTYKFTGINGELLPMREKLAEIISDLEKKKVQFEAYKNLLDMWRTLAANERHQSL